MDNDRDEELNRILMQLKKIEPTPLQISCWKEAVSRELKLSEKSPYRRRYAWTGQLAAALATGYFFGLLSHHFFGDQKKSDPVATIQYVFAKSE